MKWISLPSPLIQLLVASRAFCLDGRPDQVRLRISLLFVDTLHEYSGTGRWNLPIWIEGQFCVITHNDNDKTESTLPKRPKCSVRKFELLRTMPSSWFLEIVSFLDGPQKHMHPQKIEDWIRSIGIFFTICTQIVWTKHYTGFFWQSIGLINSSHRNLARKAWQKQVYIIWKYIICFVHLTLSPIYCHFIIVFGCTT